MGAQGSGRAVLSAVRGIPRGEATPRSGRSLPEQLVPALSDDVSRGCGLGNSSYRQRLRLTASEGLAANESERDVAADMHARGRAAAVRDGDVQLQKRGGEPHAAAIP